jgi:hypothetical protein
VNEPIIIEIGNKSSGINYPASAFAIVNSYLSNPSSIPQAELLAALAVIVVYFNAASVVLPYTTKS